MQNQKILKISSLDSAREKLVKNRLFADSYLKNKQVFSESDLLENPDIKIKDTLKLALPDDSGHHDYENAKLVFEAYKDLTPVQASDARLWVYLAHFECDKYMRLRYPIERQSAGIVCEYIMEHWYLNGISPNTLIRHGISRLWWGAYMTHDPEKKDPFELTRELFSMLDYTRTLITGTQGRNKNFTHAILEFVLENKKLFDDVKESKIRLLIRKLNYRGGHIIFPSLTKEEIKELLGTYRLEVEKTIGRDSK